VSPDGRSPGEPPPLLLSAPARLRVSTGSDWHVGSGGGTPGYVDAHVRRDADGLPYLPGTTLTGVLRDACLTVARALDDGVDGGAWQSWHRFLFGDDPTRAAPAGGRRIQPSRIGIGPARLSAGLRAEVVADRDLAAATTFVKPGVAIDAATGRAAETMLRFVEMARAGLPLEATVAVDLPAYADEGRRAVTALLVLGAAWCDRVGGDRRRGAGIVEIDFDGQDPAAWAAWLAESAWSPSPPPGPPEHRDAHVGPAVLPGETTPVGESSTGEEPDGEEPDGETRSADAAHGDGALGGADDSGTAWTRVELTIRTDAPVRVPDRTTGNIVHGHDHLPGSLLLPWLSDRWGTEAVRAGVADGGLVVRHAYPDLRGLRAVPAPLTMFAVRGSRRVVNTAAGPSPSEPTRQVRGRWTLPVSVPVGDAGAEVGGTAGGEATTRPLGLLLAESAGEVVSHNTVTRATQRPDSDSGVYTVEVIPAGRVLRGVVLLRNDVAAAIAEAHGSGWASRLAGPARLGARRRGEYGAAQVEVGEPGPDVASPAVPPRAGAVFRLWAVSDLVVRGPSLRLSAEPAAALAALTDVLDGGGLRLELAEPAASRTRRRDRWQGAWQLPRDSVVGLAAGTVLTVRVVVGTVDAQGWAELTGRGLGERRAEGFGEVLVDAALLAEPELEAVDPAGPTDTSAHVGDASGRVGDAAETSATRRQHGMAGGDGAPPADADADAGVGVGVGVTQQAGRVNVPPPRTRVVLSAGEDRALAVLRRAAWAMRVQRAVAGGRGPAPDGVRAELEQALRAVSPSQRGQWRTLTADASLRAAPGRLDAEVARWQAHHGDRRAGQRRVADAVEQFLASDRGLTELAPGHSADADDEIARIARVDALAVIVDEVVDAARRDGAPDRGAPDHDGYDHNDGDSGRSRSGGRR
jgi:CRISPR-associated protein Csx10